jgi:hypothetical protein
MTPTSDVFYFYRVESADQKGPYWTLGRGARWMEGDHYNHDAGHPSPWDDMGVDPVKTWIFGFRTLRQAQRWFSVTELRRLEDHGLKLKRVRGRLVAESDRQCCFIRT